MMLLLFYSLAFPSISVVASVLRGGNPVAEDRPSNTSNSSVQLEQLEQLEQRLSNSTVHKFGILAPKLATSASRTTTKAALPSATLVARIIVWLLHPSLRPVLRGPLPRLPCLLPHWLPGLLFEEIATLSLSAAAKMDRRGGPPLPSFRCPGKDVSGHRIKWLPRASASGGHTTAIRPLCGEAARRHRHHQNR